MSRVAFDKELEQYRNLMLPPDKFEDGFRWSSLLGAIFIALLMVPGAMYMQLVAGFGVGPAAEEPTSGPMSSAAGGGQQPGLSGDARLQEGEPLPEAGDPEHAQHRLRRGDESQVAPELAGLPAGPQEDPKALARHEAHSGDVHQEVAPARLQGGEEVVLQFAGFEEMDLSLYLQQAGVGISAVVKVNVYLHQS